MWPKIDLFFIKFGYNLIFACRFRKNKKKNESFRLKELKTAPATFLETIPLKNKKKVNKF